MGDPNLFLVEAMALKPIELQMDVAQIQELNKEWEDAMNKPLPDDEDEEFR